MNRTFLRIQSKVHQTIYRWSNGRLGSYFGAPTLLLTTEGRKSGKQYVTPLFYVHNQDEYAVVASNAGSERDPNWWLNLKANPNTQIQVKDQVLAVTARQATSDEQEQYWAQFVQMFSGYADYQNQTNREMAVVILQPTEK